ncbi:MAG: choice-of-anchor B family protein [Phycisphaerales bacterium]|nr:choice-of-anchor B family protein [Phycisphaerales bacterium]
MGQVHTSRVGYRHLAIASAILACAGSATNAHDDDVRKILDNQPPVYGEIWTQGMATPRSGGFDSSNVTLLSQIPLNNFSGVNTASGNDCWGYVSSSGREYAIMGLEGGYGFVEITNPTSPVIVETISGPSSLWHDVKVLGDYAYGVSEGGSGIQVMDMSDIDNGNVTLVRNWTGGGYSTTHNIVVNEESGSMWVVGANIGNGGLVHIDISNPELPSLDGGWTEMYIHDAQVVTWHDGDLAGREIAFAAGGFSGGFSSTGLRIVDVTDPNNTQTLSTVFYPNAGYAHQVWLSSDRKFVYLNDELDEGDSVAVTTTRVINVEDPENPFFVGTYTTGKAAIDHNLYTLDDVVYQSNYRSGLRVFDALDPANPVEVAFFDTYPGSDSASFNGAWSNYPFFPSGNIIISDIERGLFVVRVDAELRPMALAQSGSLPSTVNPAGGEVLSVEAVTRDGVAVTSVQMMLDSGSGFAPISMGDNGDGTYSASLPSVPCGSDINYYFTASTSDGFVATFPSDAPSNSLSAGVVSSLTEIYSDNFESNTGWSVTGSVDDGAWERAIPAGGGGRGDPANDFDGSGRCYLTDNVEGNSDVDGGTTTLTSPAMDASSGNTTLTYALWYSNNIGVVDDSMSIQLSNNNGGAWTTIDTLGPESQGGGWNEYSFDVGSVFANPSSQVRVRFVVSDLGEGSVVEAGVDAVQLIQLTCEDSPTGCNDADIAEPFGALNFFDISAYLAAFSAGEAAADINDDGTLNFFDISDFLGVFSAGCP